MSPALAGRLPTTAPPGKPSYFLIELFVLIVLGCQSSLYILDTNLLSDIRFANIFSHFVGCLFIFLIVSFTAQKVLIWMKSNLAIFFCYFFAFGMISKKPLPKLRSLRFTPMFSSKSFLDVVLTFKSMIHFEFIFVYGAR